MKEIILHFTSANVDCDFFENLFKASILFNLKQEVIFKDLIKLTEKHIKRDNISDRLTEYQDHSPDSWEILHYSLSKDEIEFYGKARQRYKISISKLAFIGFVLFWGLLMHIYKERLQIRNPTDIICSYQEIKKKFNHLIPYFKKRLNIIQKE